MFGISREDKNINYYEFSENVKQQHFVWKVYEMSTKIAKIVAKTKKHDQFQIIRLRQLKIVKGLECENVQCLHCFFTYLLSYR